MSLWVKWDVNSHKDEKIARLIRAHDPVPKGPCLLRRVMPSNRESFFYLVPQHGCY
jgi:hypothetical protein